MSLRHAPTPFGLLLADHRARCGLSVAALARQVGVTTVAIGDVERGKRHTMGQQLWAALVVALPSLDLDALERAAASSVAVEVRPWLLPPARQPLARRLLIAAGQLPPDPADPANPPQPVDPPAQDPRPTEASPPASGDHQEQVESELLALRLAHNPGLRLRDADAAVFSMRDHMRPGRDAKSLNDFILNLPTDLLATA